MPEGAGGDGAAADGEAGGDAVPDGAAGDGAVDEAAGGAEAVETVPGDGAGSMVVMGILSLALPLREAGHVKGNLRAFRRVVEVFLHVSNFRRCGGLCP